ncbi:hypothetical protein A5784_17065 [Mycobacterium sp. 852013-50091_SCH5140682]|uniref:nuclear transport factor 2 family protein n=1 Tax=Mycobacterium sp. 852013-50091_SCH5140682 TaxID=1834109 RepID=UPI0007EB7417|nr:nuclear transport factor 2 family protein [Mycobacterium sp. 852013-50091_SCH5140682]OBC01815.1 hypothetical protein A5784_17065 [Mycobacterium sp. 852013-50091_SCH5140682]
MSDPDDPMTTVHAYVNGFNNGDVQAMAAACADPMQILDGLAPHVWQGPTAAQDWYADALIEAGHLSVTDLHIGTGEPRHVDVAGDFALPVTFEYNLPGKHVNQTAWWTFSLRKIDEAWKLTAWSWRKGDFAIG